MTDQSFAARLRWLRAFAAFVLLFSYVAGTARPVQAAGTISLTALGSAYTQDFNTLANTGTTNTALPTGWDLNETGTSTRNNGAYAASTGSDNTGDTYSFGATDNT